MNVSDRLRRALLRWDRLLSALVIGLPFVVTSVLGFLWLLEQGLLLLFIALSLGLGAGVWLLRRLLHRQQGPFASQAPKAGEFAVQADPDWLPREKAIFDRVRLHIEEQTRLVRPWEQLPEMALDVVNQVAQGFGGADKGALHFTLPEALLLVERTASRYREHLRTQVPFSDQVSLATLQWLWRQRDRATLLWRLANGGRRVARLALSPSTAILREIEQMVAGGNSSYLSEQMMGVMQAVLLEEVAYAAIELYSGRLRFSDAELLQIQLATTSADRERLAQPDEPLRILFVGQISSGKSTLMNALLGADRAETDMAATTPGLVTYETSIEAIPCHFLDSRGLDGTRSSQDGLLQEMTQADMILWTVRANRPARSSDLALKRAFDAWFEARPERRKPLVIPVVTCMDRMVKGWPFAEHALPEKVQQTFAAIVAAIGRDLEDMQPRPVCAVEPEWNLEAVSRALEAGLSEALLVQRNRRRAQAAREAGRFFNEAKKGGRGMVQGSRALGGRLAKKVLTDKPEKKE